MEQRSTFVTVVAWIFIVFSGFGLLEVLFFSFLPFDKMLAAAPHTPGQPDPAAIMPFFRAMLVFMAVMVGWVFVSSIGLLQRKNWARISFIVFMSISAFFSGIYVLVGIFAMIFSSKLPVDPKASIDMQPFFSAMMGFMTGMSLAFTALYCWIIYKLNTDKIKQEFMPAPKG